jgi:hypothetical protein
MNGASTLERRYRRLLAWYPAAHRSVYGEEMIGVLLASAPTDQDRPSKADVLDLIGGGLRARLRRSRTGEGNPAWRDALAAFSVVAPVVLLGWLTAGYLAGIEQQRRLPPLSFHYRELVSEVHSVLLTALIATAVAVAALAVCPVLARRGRATAVAVVAVIASAAAVIGLVRVYRAFGASDDELTLYLSIIAVMEVLALVASPGPARLAVAVPPRPDRARRDLGRSHSGQHGQLHPVRILELRQLHTRQLGNRDRSRRRADAALAGWQPTDGAVGHSRLPVRGASRRPSTCSRASSSAPIPTSSSSSGSCRPRWSPCSSGWRPGGLAATADLTHRTRQAERRRAVQLDNARLERARLRSYRLPATAAICSCPSATGRARQPGPPRT